MKRRGCIDCRLIEPTSGQWVDGLCPRCRAARGLLNEKRIGRPKTRMRFRAICQQCATSFQWLSSDPHSQRQWCSVKCHLAHQRDLRRKLPDADTMRDLYVKQGLSTPRIARMYGTDANTVNAALKRAGVQLRTKTVAVWCEEPGCSNRAKKIRHTNNGSLYGTLCALHRFQHRSEMRHDYHLRVSATKRKGKGQ